MSFMQIHYEVACERYKDYVREAQMENQRRAITAGARSDRPANRIEQSVREMIHRISGHFAPTGAKAPGHFAH